MLSPRVSWYKPRNGTVAQELLGLEEVTQVGQGHGTLDQWLGTKFTGNKADNHGICGE